MIQCELDISGPARGRSVPYDLWTRKAPVRWPREDTRGSREPGLLWTTNAYDKTTELQQEESFDNDDNDDDDDDDDHDHGHDHDHNDYDGDHDHDQVIWSAYNLYSPSHQCLFCWI